MENKKKYHSNSPKNIIDKLNSAYGKNMSKNIPINSAHEENEHHGTENNNQSEEIQQQIELLKSENNELIVKIEELNNEKIELEEQVKRRLAEFENFRRRTNQEKSDLLEYGNEKMLAKLVDLLDDIKNAEQAANNTDNISAVQKGLEIIHQKTFKLFEEQGIKPMEINVGDEFNVDFHEALMHQASELPENKIVLVLQNGYFYKDKVLRYAKVITSSGPDKQSAE